MIAAQHLKELRLKHNYTQDYIAFELDIAQKTYSNIENGRSKITIDILNSLAEVYKIDPIKLLKYLTKIDIDIVKTIKKERNNLDELEVYNGINKNLQNDLINQLKERIEDLKELIAIKNSRIEELEKNIN